MRGDVIEVFPTYDDMAYRIEMWGDRDRVALADRSAVRHGQAEVHAAADLSQDALRDEGRDAGVGGGFDQGRTGVVGSRTGKAGTAGRVAAHSSAHHVRSGNDQGDGLLPWHRELFAAFHRTAAGRASADAAGLFSARFPDVHRRIAPDGAAVARHVRGRPLAQRSAGRVRIPHAVGARQPSADV